MARPRERFVERVLEPTVIDVSVRPSVAWGGVFSGFFVAAALVLLLTVLGVAVGVTVLPDLRTAPGFRLGIGAGIWATLSLLLGFFVGGMVSARAPGADPTEVAQHTTRLGAWITLIALLTTLLVAIAGALIATPTPDPHPTTYD